MQISVVSPIEQTIIFTLLLSGALLFSLHKKNNSALFSTSVTNELKGWAILAIIISHIGYFLSTDTRFLFPLSIFAGVGVDLFLFLSGYGLTASSLRRPLSIKEFYTKRLGKIFVPMWVTVIIFLLLDRIVSDRVYSLTTLWQTLIGFFPTADLFHNLNSPLWYFTFILIYYLLYPFIFHKRWPTISALILLIAGYLFLKSSYNPETVPVVGLYRLHVSAFPLGMMFAVFVTRHEKRFETWIQELSHKFARLLPWLRYSLLLGLIYLVGYNGIHSAVGQGPWKEQIGSLITAGYIILIFIIKPIEFKFLNLVGVYSYELYLMHWPILYRYDIFYNFIPAGLATFLYLLLFVALGFSFRKLGEKMPFQKHI